MLQAIKETTIILEVKKKKNKEDRKNSGLSKARNKAFETIEKVMGGKKLKTQDLREYANYQEQINNLDKVYKIRDLRDKIYDVAIRLSKEKEQEDNDRKPRENPNPQFPDEPNNPQEKQKSE